MRPPIQRRKAQNFLTSGLRRMAIWRFYLNTFRLHSVLYLSPPQLTNILPLSKGPMKSATLRPNHKRPFQLLFIFVIPVCLLSLFVRSSHALQKKLLLDPSPTSVSKSQQKTSTEALERRPMRRPYFYEVMGLEGQEITTKEDEEDDDDEDDRSAGDDEASSSRRHQKSRRAFGQSDYLLPENFRSLRRKDIPVTYRLHDDLLRYYRKGTRPVTHPSKIISVSMSVFLYQIIKLDAVKNTISLSGSFELYWQDEFLQWEPDTYEGATEIFLASTDIWIPEFSLYYSVNFNDAVRLQSNNDVRVNYTGHVRYWIPFSTESLCNSMDVKFFPFDIQRCTLLLGSWAHSNDSIKYSLYSKNLSLIDFYDNQEWQLDLRQSHITSDGFLYDYLDPPLFWEMIVIDLVVSRQSFYYVFNLVIPSAMITFVAVVGFHTPSSSGKNRDAKFRQGIMTLMSMSMILLAIVQDMPKFSMSERKGRGSFSGIPLIGIYYFMLLVIVSLSTVTSSMFVYMERNVRIHHKIPFYLRWMIALERTKKQFSKRYSFRRPKWRPPPVGGDMETSTIMTTSHGHLNGSVGAGLGGSGDDRQNLLMNARQHRNSGSMTASGKTTQNVAMSLLRLISCDKEQREAAAGDARQRPKEERQSRTKSREYPGGVGALVGGRDSSGGSQQRQPSPMPSARKRHSLLATDNLLVHQSCLLEGMAQTFGQLTAAVQAIRQDLSSLVPQNDMDGDWQKAIRRLELCSLAFYITLLVGTMLMFFYHDWYCYIGYNPCGQQNLKCPWLSSDSSSPSCLS